MVEGANLFILRILLYLHLHHLLLLLLRLRRILRRGSILPLELIAIRLTDQGHNLLVGFARVGVSDGLEMGLNVELIAREGSALLLRRGGGGAAAAAPLGNGFDEGETAIPIGTVATALAIRIDAVGLTAVFVKTAVAAPDVSKLVGVAMAPRYLNSAVSE